MVKRTNPLLIVSTILFSIIFILPFIIIIIWSFTKQWPWPRLFPENLTFDSWRYIFSPTGQAWRGLMNSTHIAFWTLLFNLCLAIPAAKAMVQRSFIGKGLAYLILLSPLFIPITAAVMGLHLVAIRLHWLPDVIAVSLAHTIITFPYMFAVVWFQFRLLGSTLQEAAKSLGASSWQTFFLIELPLVRQAIYLGSLLVIIVSFSQYIPTWIMSGGAMVTLPMIIFPFADSGNSSIVAAYSLWFFIPIMLVVICYLFLLKMASGKGR